MKFWIPQREMGTDSKALAEDSLRDGENNKEDVGQGPRSGVGPSVNGEVGYCGECEDCVALGFGPETPVSPLTDLVADLYLQALRRIGPVVEATDDLNTYNDLGARSRYGFSGPTGPIEAKEEPVELKPAPEAPSKAEDGPKYGAYVPRSFATALALSMGQRPVDDPFPVPFPPTTDAPPEADDTPRPGLGQTQYSPYPYGPRQEGYTRRLTSPYPTFEAQLKTITEAIKAAEKLLAKTNNVLLPGSFQAYVDLGKALEAAMALSFPREVFEKGYNKGYERGLNAAATDVKNTRLSREGILERIEDRRKVFENGIESVQGS